MYSMPRSAANFTTLTDLCTAHVSLLSFLKHVHTKLILGSGQPRGKHGGYGQNMAVIGSPYLDTDFSWWQQCDETLRPVFNPRLASAVLLYDANLEGYCRRHCRCPVNEDKWLYAAQKEAMQQKGITPLRQPTYMDNPRPAMIGPPMMGPPPGREEHKEAPMTLSKYVRPQTFYGRSWVCTTPADKRGLICSCKRPQPRKGPAPVGRPAPLAQPAPMGPPVPFGNPQRPVLNRPFRV